MKIKITGYKVTPLAVLNSFAWSCILMNYKFAVTGALNRSCLQNCSTYVFGDNNNYNLIPCEIERGFCKNTSSDPPMRPSKNHSSWFIYKDAETNYRFDKIALNFSWGPAFDASIEELEGYEITVCQKASKRGCFKTYFCLYTPMDFYKHIKAVFYYDCYGIARGEVEPGSTFNVEIRSVPLPPSPLENVLSMLIAVPNCSFSEMHNVRSCVVQRQLSSSLDEVFCNNRSIQLTYNVPMDYGPTAILKFCKNIRTENLINLCEEEVIPALEGLPLNTTLYNITLPNEYQSSETYVILVYGYANKVTYSMQTINFKDCDQYKSRELLYVMVGVSISVILIFIIVIIRCIFTKSKKQSCNTGVRQKNDMSLIEQTPKNSGIKKNVFDVMPPPPLYPQHKDKMYFSTNATSYEDANCTENDVTKKALQKHNSEIFEAFEDAYSTEEQNTRRYMDEKQDIECIKPTLCNTPPHPSMQEASYLQRFISKSKIDITEADASNFMRNTSINIQPLLPLSNEQDPHQYLISVNKLSKHSK